MYLNDIDRKKGLKFYRKILSYSIFRYLIWVLVLLVVYWGYHGANRLGLFQINDVEVVGYGEDLKYISAKKITRSIKEERYNFLELKTNELSKKIKPSSEFIKDLYIDKIFPNKLKVEIVEYVPYIYIEQNNEVCVLVTSDGYVIDKRDFVEDDCVDYFGKYSVPLLALDGNMVQFDKGQKSNFTLTKTLSDITSILAEYGYSCERMILKDSVLKLFFNKTSVIIFSISQDTNLQLARFISVAKELEKTGIEAISIDLRYRRPVVREKD